MSKGFDMLRDYIEHDALCMRRRKCCDFEYELQQEFAALEAENAKLRELASILCFCMQVHAQCDDCKLNGAKGELAHDQLCACDGLHEILQALGIEVDKWMA